MSLIEPADVEPAPRLESDAQRLVREAAFHDEAFGHGGRKVVSKYYRITAESSSRYQDLVRAHSSGGRVLEYGCGVGSSAYEVALTGATVVGIDISPVAIELATRTAADKGVSKQTSFQLMNAERLEFSDASFDFVCGSGILHHLDLSLAYAEIARVLKSGGRAVFFEPLGHNPLINLYRRLTPSLRTPDEHPLKRADIDLARKHFSEVVEESYHLLTIGLAFMPSWLGKLYRPVAALLDGILLHRRSPFRYQGWIVVLQFVK